MQGEDTNEETDLGVPGSGGRRSKASRREGVVLRQAGPWSRTVMALLCYLEDSGFTGAPRVVGPGFADDGREMLTFIPGESPQPYAWSDEAVARIGSLLRELHDATSSFRPPPDAVWHPWFGRELQGSNPVIGHCDIGPWNVIAQHSLPVAFVDWEFAGPVDALWELAHAAWLNAQLHDDDLAERLGLPSASARANQVRLILDAYQLASSHRPGFIDKLITVAVHSARAEAVEFGVTPDAASAFSDSGFPVLWGITWRVRSASWMLRHRPLLEKAVT